MSEQYLHDWFENPNYKKIKKLLQKLHPEMEWDDRGTLNYILGFSHKAIIEDLENDIAHLEGKW